MNEQEILESFGSWNAYDEWCDEIRADIIEEEALIEDYFKDSEADRVISEMKEFPQDW